jgi:NADH-quinone oxidoreductase subunit G
MGDFNITVNDKTVPVTKGQTVLQAALAAGIDIPVFCWHPQLVPVGACRICLVEIEKFPKLQVACATPATDGMIVRTESPKVVKARHGVLEFILAHHPLDCPTCDKGGECDLQNITFKYGLDYSRLQEPKHRTIVDENSTFDDLQIGPEIIRNQNRCIHCYRCTRIVDEACFEDDLGAYQRGYHTEILPPPNREIRNLYSGNVVEYCPVGALTNDDWRYKVRVWLTKQANTVCTHCPDGCNLTHWTFHNKIFRATARPNENIDRGFICDIGRYGYQFVASNDRLKKPMVRKNGELVESSWDEALTVIKNQVTELRSKLSGNSFFGFIGETSTNEEIYAFQRLLRRVVGTNHIDSRITRKRRLSFGDDVSSRKVQPDQVSYQDIDAADTFVVYASDLHSENPITSLRVKRGVRQRDARIIIINARKTHLGERTGALNLVHKPGTGLVALLGIVDALISHANFDKTTTGLSDQHLAEFKQSHAAFAVSKAVEITGITDSELREAAEILAKAKNVVILCGSEFNRYPFRDEELLALDNLRRVCKAAKLAVLPEYSNSVGAELLGAQPGCLPGFNGSESKSKFEELWRGPLPEFAGKDTIGIFEAINEDEIECGFVYNLDPVRVFPDGQYASSVLEKLKFLVVIDSFMTDTARLADVILPVATAAATEGTLTNWEGRIQYSQAALKPMFESKTGCEIFELLADRLGSAFGQSRPIEVYSEINKVLGNTLPVRYEMFKAEGVQFPLPKNGAAPGLNKVAHNPYPTDKDYPFYLIVGNADHHRGHDSERNYSLMKFTGEPFVGLNETETKALMVSEGDLVKVESRTGKVVGKAKLITDLPDRVIFLPENFGELRPNLLMGLKEKFDHVKLVKM